MTPPRVSASWSTVSGLTPGTQIAIYLNGPEVRYGHLELVTDRSLAVRLADGLQSFDRNRIERLAVRTPTGASRSEPILQTALIAAAITGGLALLAKSMEENPRPSGGKWTFFVVGTTAGAGVGALRAPRETFIERLIYIRP